VLRNALGGVARSIGSLVSRQAGGGILGGLLGNLVGGGLGLLAGKLFQRRERVSVAGVVQTEVLNFPRLSDIGLATNPASRLFGGRAVPHGPAFTVTVDYKQGAEDVVSAKVASKLSELNAMQGMN
jgi:hypothetical protein